MIRQFQIRRVSQSAAQGHARKLCGRNPRSRNLYILCLTPLSAIFQLYHGDKFWWWRKPEYLERTTDPGQATGKLYHLWLRVECILFCNLRRIGDRLVWVVRSNDLTHWATRAPPYLLKRVRAIQKLIAYYIKKNFIRIKKGNKVSKTDWKIHILHTLFRKPPFLAPLASCFCAGHYIGFLMWKNT
jgi:hypothetical protein